VLAYPLMIFFKFLLNNGCCLLLSSCLNSVEQFSDTLHK